MKSTILCLALALALYPCETPCFAQDSSPQACAYAAGCAGARPRSATETLLEMQRSSRPTSGAGDTISGREASAVMSGFRKRLGEDAGKAAAGEASMKDSSHADSH